MFSAGVTSTYERLGLPSMASSSSYSCFISPSQTSKHLQMSKQSPSSWPTLWECSPTAAFPERGWERKRQEHGRCMLACTSPPPDYPGLSPAPLLYGAVPRAKIRSHFFSGSCQGYSGWYVKDVGLLAILGRQEPGGPCRGHEASRQGDCGRPGPLWVTSEVVQVPWRTKPR